MTMFQAVSTTKILNTISSLVATLVFMAKGLVDYRMGIFLGVVMFCGAFIGGRVTLKINDVWLRRIFMMVATDLACKILLYDFLMT